MSSGTWARHGRGAPPAGASGQAHSDGGGRYLDTCFDDQWLDQHGCDVEPSFATLEEVFEAGRWGDG